MADAFGHLAYDLFADGAVAGYRIAADVYEVLLGIEAVSHYAAFEIGRGAGMAVKRAAMVPPVQLSAVARVWMRSVRSLCTRSSGC